MSLLVDPRQGSGEFKDPLRRAGCPATHARMKYADFAWNGHGPHGWCRVGVERKTVTEILGAITDSRFTGHQIPGLLAAYDYVYLVVEGAVRIDPRSGVLMLGGREAGFTRVRHSYSTYKKFLNTLAIKGRMIVEPTSGFRHTVSLLHTLYRWWAEPWSKHKSAYQVAEVLPDQAILDERTIKRQVAAQLPGVAWQRSKAVSEYFPTLAAMMLATEEEWMAALKVKKGRKMARTLVQVCQANGARGGEGDAKH